MPRLAHAVPDRRTVQAYVAVGEGRGSLDDWRLMRADLEAFTGFWDVTTPDTPEGETKFAEGQRSVFGRIQALMRVTTDALDQIEAARETGDEI